MPARHAQPITFAVPGRTPTSERGTRTATASSLPAGLTTGRVTHAVRVVATRGTVAEARVSAMPGRDVVVLTLAGGPALVLHPETARDLLVAQGPADQARDGGSRRSRSAVVPVPARLQWRSAEAAIPTRGGTRGWLGDVLLSAVDVVTDLSMDSAAAATAAAIAKHVDGHVEAGVHALEATALRSLKGSGQRRETIPPDSDGGPTLVLVHGTFSDTCGTFSKLWTQHPSLVQTLFAGYRGRVFALDHPTLTASPVTNALMLASALPSHTRLHLMTHSRGGLVAEALARAAAGESPDVSVFSGSEYAKERQHLQQLIRVMREKAIRVDRVVRVACPARGTLLCSRRLDAFLSVFKWSLDLAGVPVAPRFVDFLAAVAKRRTDPAEFPGLAAQMPDSPLVQWLHQPGASVDGDLRIVAGDLSGDSVTSWLKTLVTDAFYWTDHDLVVQTRSMYGGSPRRDRPTFVLDQGAQVSHFGYFSNERTAGAIVTALVDARPTGFRPVGALSEAGISSTGTRAVTKPARGRNKGRASTRPAVVLVPPVPEIAAVLSPHVDVIDFSADWAAPVEDEAARLAQIVAAALDARRGRRQPVHLLAYSFGALIARAVQLERPAVWKRLLAHPNARVILVAPPNNGSWSPMQLLSGDDPFGERLASLAGPLASHTSREELARSVGLLQQQAGWLDASLGLAHRETWQNLAEADVERSVRHSPWHSTPLQTDALRWGVPSQAVIDRAVALRRRLDAQQVHVLPGLADRLRLIVGGSKRTASGVELTPSGVVYLDVVNGGDGRVTLESATLPGVRTWCVELDHGQLPHDSAVAAACLDLIQRGDTKHLPELEATPAGVRGTGERLRSRPGRSKPAVAPGRTTDVYAVDEVERDADVPGAALRISVVNGDLSFVSNPLLIGHYRSMRLTGTESVINRLIGGAMSDSLATGVYPDAPGSHRVFINRQIDPTNPWRLPRPEAVIVAGLGAEGALQSAELVHTIRQAVIAWSQRMAEQRGGAPATYDLAATLIGSGGTGISPGQSAQLVAQGVREANRALDDQQGDRRWPRVAHLHLIELYLDRAGEAWRALRMQALSTPGDYLVTEAIEAGTGPLPRPIDSGYRGADYDLITALSERGPAGEPRITYTLDTKRARTEVRAQATQAALLRELVAKASNDRNRDTQIGRTLFQLLVPIEMEPFLGGTTDAIVELDTGTAGIPWELLDTTTGAGRDERPWAIRTKLLRKLRTADFRGTVVDADADARVLVIGEPACDTAYPRLPGARLEARTVAARLGEPGALSTDRITTLVPSDEPDDAGADARTILNTLLAHNWRIVHLAGHGEPPRPDGEPGGVVLSNGTYLGPREIRSMRVVPELVFVNCCHLAGRQATQLLEPPDRARFAANVAEELIKIGVRCVIAAGWAVEDGPACDFAATFYEAVIGGRRFIDAVAVARDAASAHGGNTWAAYQCYGDPDWTFRTSVADAQRPRLPLGEEFAGVASALGLTMALETLAVRSRFQGAAADAQQARLRHLEARFAGLWGHIGSVAEAFGAAWSAAGDGATAAGWYSRALAANDGTASIKAAEQLSNITARRAWERVEKATRDRKPAPKGGTARTLRQTAAEARREIAAAIDRLETLVKLEPSMERETLCGSAYKLLALLEHEADRPAAERRAIEMMRRHYRRAESLGRTARLDGYFYPALNLIAAELAIEAGTGRWRGLDEALVGEVRQSLEETASARPDFWSLAGQVELKMYEAIARSTLGKARASLTAAYADLHARVSATWMWDSVRDQARFVLTRYTPRAQAPDQRAARALLARLDEYAGISAPASPKSSTP